MDRRLTQRTQRRGTKNTALCGYSVLCFNHSEELLEKSVGHMPSWWTFYQSLFIYERQTLISIQTNSKKEQN